MRFKKSTATFAMAASSKVHRDELQVFAPLVSMLRTEPACSTDAMAQSFNAPQNSDSCCGGSSFGLDGTTDRDGCSDAKRSASAMTRGIFLKSSRITSFTSALCRPAAGGYIAIQIYPYLFRARPWMALTFSLPKNLAIE